MDEAAKTNRKSSPSLELVRLTLNLWWICQDKHIISSRKNSQLLLGIQNEKIICFCPRYWTNCLYFICKSLTIPGPTLKIKWDDNECWLDYNILTHREHSAWPWRAEGGQHRWERSRCSPRRWRGPHRGWCSRPRHRPRDPPEPSLLTCARQCWAPAPRRPRTSGWPSPPASPSSGRSWALGRSGAGLKHTDFEPFILFRCRFLSIIISCKILECFI